MTEIVGGYSDFELYQQRREQQKKEAQKVHQEKQQQAETKKAAAPARSNKLSYKLKLELESLPSKVEELEEAVNKQQALVSDPDFFKQDQETTHKALNHLTELESKLEAAFERWEELEALQNQQ